MVDTILLAVLVALTVIGGGGLVYWLRQNIGALKGTVEALKGTVEAQQATLATMSRVNETVLEVFKVLDPKRWAAEVEVHRKLSEERAAALVEKAQREFDHRRQTAEATAVASFRTFSPFAAIALKFMPHVPKARRKLVIDAAPLDPELKADMLKWAEDTAEMHAGGLFGLISAQAVGEALRIPPRGPVEPPPSGPLTLPPRGST